MKGFKIVYNLNVLHVMGNVSVLVSICNYFYKSISLFPFELRIRTKILIFLPIKPRNFALMTHTQFPQSLPQILRPKDESIVIADIDDLIVRFGGVTGVIQFEGIQFGGRIGEESAEHGGLLNLGLGQLPQIIQTHPIHIQIVKYYITEISIFK